MVNTIEKKLYRLKKEREEYLQSKSQLSEEMYFILFCDLFQVRNKQRSIKQVKKNLYYRKRKIGK